MLWTASSTRHGSAMDGGLLRPQRFEGANHAKRSRHNRRVCSMRQWRACSMTLRVRPGGRPRRRVPALPDSYPTAVRLDASKRREVDKHRPQRFYHDDQSAADPTHNSDSPPPHRPHLRSPDKRNFALRCFHSFFGASRVRSAFRRSAAFSPDSASRRTTRRPIAARAQNQYHLVSLRRTCHLGGPMPPRASRRRASVRAPACKRSPFLFGYVARTTLFGSIHREKTWKSPLRQ
jgi:hypothetical protein